MGIKKRDFPNSVGFRCLLCSEIPSGGVGKLEGAHIYPYKSVKSITIEEASMREVLVPNTTSNGILLCETCHTHFDNGLWWISQDYRSFLSTALKQVAKYEELHNLQFNFPLNSTAPNKGLLHVQENFCEEKRKQRHAELLKKPLVCEVCSNRYELAWALNDHKKLRNCVAPFAKPLFSPPTKAQQDAASSAVGSERNRHGGRRRKAVTSSSKS
jgi:hypothetical protein